MAKMHYRAGCMSPRLTRALRLALIPVAACSALAASAAPSQSAPSFDAVAFFTGNTTGEGTLKKMFSAAQVVRVTGRGRVEGGVLVLDQTVSITGEPRRERQWRLRAGAPGRWSGTLSDAKGPVLAQASGAVLTIAYTSDEGMGITQTVTLAPDGNSARNRMKIRKLGMTVATIDETITRD